MTTSRRPENLFLPGFGALPHAAAASVLAGLPGW